jgi:hypothetical protein
VLRAGLAMLVVVLIAGCGGDGEPSGTGAHRAPAKPPRRPAAKPPRVAWPRRVPCPPSAANCRSARGTIIYIEAVDPDGDGDAHFVLTSASNVTGGGLTVIDVEKALRPHPLPQVGDRVSAAGPVYRGSYGQRQIQATELHVIRAHGRR